VDVLRDALQRRVARYDKSGEEHYNLISAYHKALRGSDPQGALYWLARMIDGGEDPMYIARRTIRFASEDVGLADPQALRVALAAQGHVQFEGHNIALTQPHGLVFSGAHQLELIDPAQQCNVKGPCHDPQR